MPKVRGKWFRCGVITQHIYRVKVKYKRFVELVEGDHRDYRIPLHAFSIAMVFGTKADATKKSKEMMMEARAIRPI